MVSTGGVGSNTCAYILAGSVELVWRNRYAYFLSLCLHMFLLQRITMIVWLTYLAGYVDPESDGSLEQDLRSRRYSPLMGGGDDEYDSDE